MEAVSPVSELFSVLALAVNAAPYYQYYMTVNTTGNDQLKGDTKIT